MRPEDAVTDGRGTLTAGGDHVVRQWLRAAACPPRVRLLGRIVTGAAAVAELAVPFVVGAAVTRTLSGGRLTIITGLTVVAAVVCAGVLAGLRTMVLTRTAASEMRRLRFAVAEHLIGMSPRDVEHTGVDEALSTASRSVDGLEPLLTASRAQRAMAITTAACCVILMALFEWRLVATLVVAAVLSSAAVAVALRGLRARAEAALTSLGTVSAEVGEYLRSIRSATVFGLGPRYLSRVSDQLTRVECVETQVGRSQSIVDTTIKVVSLGALLGVAVVGVSLVRSGVTTPGRLSAFLVTMAIALAPLAGYVESVQAKRRAEAALPKLAALGSMSTEPAGLAETPRALAWEAPAPLSVRFDEVVVRPGENVEVGPVSLVVTRGEIICLVGPSGSGKSSVLGAVVGFLPVIHGSLRVGGVAVGDMPAATLRSLVAYVEQGTPMVGGTVREFLCVDHPAPTDAELWSLIERVGLSERLSAVGLDAPLERAGTSLSGGERQRLSLVRAFATRRPILILDEPTSQLDAVSENAVVSLLRTHAEDRVVLVASHAPKIVEQANLVVNILRDVPGPPPDGSQRADDAPPVMSSAVS